MKRAILRDDMTGERHDLIALLEKNGGDISVGRREHGNMIELGQYEAPEIAKRISRKHATISAIKPRDFYMFYIKDHSTNGTMVNNRLLTIEDEPYYLRRGAKILFGGVYLCTFEEEDVVSPQSPA